MKKVLFSFLFLVLVSCSSMKDQLTPYVSGDLEELIFKTKMLNSTHLMANFHVKGDNLWPSNLLFKRLDKFFKQKGLKSLPKHYGDLNKTKWVISEYAGNRSASLNAFWFDKKENILVNVMVSVFYNSQDDFIKKKHFGSSGIISVSYDKNLNDLIKTSELIRYVTERQAEILTLDGEKWFKSYKVQSGNVKNKNNTIEIIEVRRAPDSESEINAQSTKEKNSKK